MFRIPDYVAENRPDGVTSIRTGSSPRRKATRLGLAIFNRFTPPAMPARRPGPNAAGAGGPPAADLSEDEQRLQAHVLKRQAESQAFHAERGFRAMQREADRLAATGRAETGPSGEGLTVRVAGDLSTPGERLMASLPPQERAVMSGRVGAESGRRLAKASAEEVRTRRDWTRAELGQMQQQLLAELAADPERFDDLAEQGARLAVRNTLPDAEKAGLAEGWRRATARTLAGTLAGLEDPETLKLRFGLVSVDANGTPSDVDLDDLTLHPAFLSGNDDALRRHFSLADADPRVADLPVSELIRFSRAAEQRAETGRQRAAADMALRLKQDGVLIAQTGAGLPDLSHADVEAALGKAAAGQWLRDRQIGVRVFHTLEGADHLPRGILETRVAQLKPSAGEPDFEVNREASRIAREKADAIVNRRDRDPAAAVGDFDEVRARRQAHEQDPTVRNRFALSNAIMDAQAEIGIEPNRRSPLMLQKAEEIGRWILDVEGPARIDEIRRLAADLQIEHGEHADSALRAIARFWADDRQASQFAGFLAEQMDDALILREPAPARDIKFPSGAAVAQRDMTVKERIDRAFIDAEGYQPADRPLTRPEVWISNDFAREHGIVHVIDSVLLPKM